MRQLVGVHNFGSAYDHMCSLTSLPTAGKMEGEEDCLYLDVVVPRGVDRTDGSRPVMVWIHGGGYVLGHRMQYPSAALAVHGDVIVVTINYRLGVFGFLYNGPGKYRCHLPPPPLLLPHPHPCTIIALDKKPRVQTTFRC